MNKIYTITTMTKLEQDKLDWSDYGSTRTVGWFNNFDEAERTVVYNYRDIWETCYDYAIIEEKKPLLFNDMLIAMNTYHYMPDKPIYKYLSSNAIRAVLFNMVMYNELCFDVNILKCIRLMQEKAVKIKNNDDFLTSSDNI